MTHSLTYSLNHIRLLYTGRYTQQAGVKLFKSTPHEHCTKYMNCNFTQLITVKDLISFCISNLFCFHIYKAPVLCFIVWVLSLRLKERTMSKVKSSSHNAPGHPYPAQSKISLKTCSNIILKSELTSTRSYLIHGWRYGLHIDTATINVNG